MFPGLHLKDHFHMKRRNPNQRLSAASSNESERRSIVA